MRKKFLALAIGVLLVMAVPASAADLHPAHVNTTCEVGQRGVWHFVNNQTGGIKTPGTLNVVFSGDGTGVFVADKVNGGTQHWTVSGGATLVSASTNLPGKLVLSDFTCEDVKK